MKIKKLRTPKKKLKLEYDISLLKELNISEIENAVDGDTTKISDLHKKDIS